MSMKETKDKPEKSSGEVTGEPGERAVSPARSAQGTPARGEVRRAAKKAFTRREDEEEVSPDAQTERPAPDAALVEHDVSHHAASPDPNIKSLGLDLVTGDLLGGNLTIQEAAPREYFPLNISSIHVETLSEYFAEEEVEAAMLEADLAMYTDECALVCDEGLDLVELAQEEVSIEWAKRGFEF
jgi:hypothetical protein